MKAEHPFWGDRRLWAYLRCVGPLAVHKQRRWRLMREHHLVVPPPLKRKAKRTPSRDQPRPTKPTEWWGSDLTKVLGEGFGWAYSVVVLDWDTTKIVGDDAGRPCTAQHRRSALDRAVNGQCPAGTRGQGVSLLSDNGCQPPAQAFMAACRTLGIQQALTSDNHPKGHADTERGMRTRKAACLWLQEWATPFA